MRAVAAEAAVKAIVIGTSAGGIDALSRLLPRLPAALVVPVFVVVHLPRDRPSLLTALFVPRCALQVREAMDKEPVLPGHLYFAPPDYHLLIEHSDGACHLALSADALVNYSRPSIDVLFESAADAYGSGLLGVILTGANHDGAAGLAAIAAAGGQAVVQSPASAEAPQMIQAALGRVPAARVLSLDGIGELFCALASAR